MNKKIKKILREMYRRFIAIISTFSPRLASKIYYRTKLRKKLDLKKPMTFNEKLMWLKLNEYENNELISNCVDKYRVREFVEKCGCGEILNELIGVYDNANEIDFDSLPNKFVLKCNHAAGYNIICGNKDELDIIKTKKQLNKWVKSDYWKYVAELQYKNVKKKIVCEKYLESKDNNAIQDYKIYCFNGKPAFCMICVERNLGKPKYYFMDREWKIMKINPSLEKSPLYLDLEKPKCIDKMYEYAEKLSKPFKFVRVDFYDYNDKPIFGELTFTPAGCVDEDYTPEAHIEIGNMLDLNKKKNVLMLGPARTVKGGMTSVVDNYFESGLDKKVNLKYIETINDKFFLFKILKMIKGYFEFIFNIDKYELVHIHVASRMSTYRKGKYVRIAKRKGKRVILHIHGAEYKIFYDECNNKQKNYVKDTLKLCDKIIVLSEEWKDFFKQLVDEEKIEVIYNAIVICENFKKDINTQKVLFLGKFGQRKGIYDLLEVMKRLTLEYPKLFLTACGDGEIETVKKIVKEKELEKNVQVLSWVKGKEKEKLLKESTFYILPSYNEGMPMSLIEGMSYKNVSISTNVGGIPKVIENNENGILIEPGNIQLLYDNMKKLLNDNELRIKLSENARKTIEKKFNIEDNIKKIVSIYEG